MNADYSRPFPPAYGFEIADSCARGLSGPKPASTLFRTVDDLWNASQRALKKRKKERNARTQEEKKGERDKKKEIQSLHAFYRIRRSYFPFVRKD